MIQESGRQLHAVKVLASPELIHKEKPAPENEKKLIQELSSSSPETTVTENQSIPSKTLATPELRCLPIEMAKSNERNENIMQPLVIQFEQEVPKRSTNVIKTI